MNKSKCKIILLMVISFSLFSCKNNKLSTNDNNKDIVILSTNDTYSAYNANLGYAGIKNFIDSIDKSENEIVLVDTGNFSTGCDIAIKSKGKSSIKIINELNYDYIVPGVHEFDYGIETFIDNMEMLGDKVLCCNIVDCHDNTLLFKPYDIRIINGKKIAFLGVTSPDVININRNIFFDDEGNQLLYFFEENNGINLLKQIQGCVNEAKENGADKVVLLSHLGVKNVRDIWQSTYIVSKTVGIDCVIDGHSMELMDGGLMTNARGEFVQMIQAGSHLEYLGVMNISKDGFIFPAILSKNSIKNKDKNILKLINDLEKQYK